MEKRIVHEKEHGKKIAANAETVWNWNSPAGKKRAEKRARYIIETGKIKSSDRVLEIGCGTGLFTEKIYNATHANITGIDISEDLLEVAREKLRQTEFRMEDAMNLTYEDNSFDVVCGSSVLHHLDLLKSYSEIFRVLKPRGRMVFAEPNMLNPQIFIQKNIPFIKKWLGDSPDETAIIRFKTKKQLAKIGYKNIRIFPYDFLHPSTPKALINIVEVIGRAIEKLPLLKEISGSVIIYAEK